MCALCWQKKLLSEYGEQLRSLSEQQEHLIAAVVPGLEERVRRQDAVLSQMANALAPYAQQSHDSSNVRPLVSASAPQPRARPSASADLPLASDGRMVPRKRPQPKRLTKQPLVEPLAVLQARKAKVRADSGSHAATPPSTTSSKTAGLRVAAAPPSPVTGADAALASPSSIGAVTIMTITIEGSLAGPPEFDREAFKAKLAQRLEMRSDHFKVKRVNGRGGTALHEVETGGGCSVRVDIDEEGYLRHESSSSSGSGSDTSELSEEDRELFASTVTFALKKALELQRVSRQAIEVLWTDEAQSSSASRSTYHTRSS